MGESAVSKRPEVLVVEDDLLFSVRIENTLKRLGYAVTVLGNGPEAIAHAERHAPALAIVNFGKESTNPSEVVKHLKRLPDAPPVLGYVSHVWLPQVRPNAMAVGCDLLVANSALTMRLQQLVARLAPLDGSAARVHEAAQFAEDAEE